MTDPDDAAATSIPERQIRDPRALRALAHPARVRILEELAIGGPATATELAERIGESAANCSWHLRQLARYGFVDEAGGGTGRQRPWRIVVQQNSWPTVPDDEELAVAGDAAAQMVFAREVEHLHRWRAAARFEPPQWRNSAVAIQAIGWLTAEELRAVKREVAAILLRYADRIANEAARPPGSRPIRFLAWGVPGDPGRAPVPDEPSPEED